MEIKETYLGKYDVTEGEKILGEINKAGEKYKITKNGKYVGYIGLKEIIQTYNAYNEQGNVVGEGNFENMLSVFF